MELVNAIGRRKAAIARVYLKEGSGNIVINDREFKNYFTTPQLQYTVLQPLSTIQAESRFDIQVNLDGGGTKGQAEALRLAISRALLKVSPELRPSLKSKGFLSRDSRVVERKKPGQKKARKRFQFSKR